MRKQGLLGAVLIALCVVAAPVQAESVYLIVAAGGEGPGAFQPYDGSPGQSYQVYRWADIIAGSVPGALTMDVMSTIPEGSLSDGSQYFYLADLTPGSSHLGVSTPEGGAPLQGAFEQATIRGVADLPLLDPSLGAIGGGVTLDAVSFWGHFVASQQGGGSFTDTDFADFVNQSAGFVNFNPIETLVLGINDDDFSGFTNVQFLGITRTTLNRQGVLNAGGGGGFFAFGQGIPEPASLALVGLGVLAVIRKRRRKTA